MHIFTSYLKPFCRYLRLRIHWAQHIAKFEFISRINKCITPRSADIGAGRDAHALGWWTADYQEGVVIDSETILPFDNEQLNFAYCSMFFEHIDDQVAANLLREVHRSLKKNSKFRIVVPNFWLYCDKYKSGDYDFFWSLNKSNPNLETWGLYNVPTDLEHLFISMITSIHNLPHTIVSYPWQENLHALPPKVCHPFQQRLKGYYCGPAPEISSEQVKYNFNKLHHNDFLVWLFRETNRSQVADKTFNSWHENFWNFEKLQAFAAQAGFSRVEESSFDMQYFPREKSGHSPIALYFNLIK